jgi:hypothetical protein
MKIKNATGKAAAAIHFEPRNRNPPAATTLTKARAIRERPSLTLKLSRNAIPAINAAKPMLPTIAVPTIELRYAAGYVPRSM